MTIEELRREVLRLGIRLRAAGDRIRVIPLTEKPIPAEVKAAIRDHKAELLAALSWEAEAAAIIQRTMRQVELGFPPEHVQGDAPLPTWNRHYRAIDDAVFTRNRQALEAALEAFENAARRLFNRWWTNYLDRAWTDPPAGKPTDPARSRKRR